RGGALGGLEDCGLVRNGSVNGEAGVVVPPKALAQGGLADLGEHVDPEVGRSDGIGLVDDLCAPLVEAGGGFGEREGDEPTQQPEDSAVDRTQNAQVRAASGVPPAKAPSQDEASQQR